MIEVLIELFQKFAEHEAEPRTNAKALAFANVLQNREASLPKANIFSDFGQSQYFPNVGKYCALSPRARRAQLPLVAVIFSLRESDISPSAK